MHKSSGRPKALKPCPLGCGQSFGAREMRKHKPLCAKQKREAAPENEQPMKGRKPKPIARQIAEGDPSKRGVHKLDERLAAEPQATRGLPACPSHLTGRARAAWKFWVEELKDMNIDRRPDAMMLEGACVNYARAVQADQMVTDQGMMVEESMVDEDTGDRVVLKIKYHPAITVSNAAWRQVRAFCSEFGLSPVSRTRLSIDKKEQTEDLAKLLMQPRAAKPAQETVQ